MPQFLQIYDVQVNHGYTVIIPQRRGNKTAKRCINNTVKGTLSKKSKHKIQHVLTAWNEVLRCAPLAKRRLWRIQPRFTMLTLTLPSKQLHKDEEIKTKCLNPFLTDLKKAVGFNLLYLWSAEAQIDTGNIHFHIVTDRFICKDWARSVWNRIVDRLGYVERSGLTAPPSTDIRTCPINQQTVNYLMKYITKKSKKGTKVRDLTGKLWGCSHKLLKLRVSVNSEAVGMDLVEFERNAIEKGLKVFMPSIYVTYIPHNTKERHLLYGSQYDKLLEQAAVKEYDKISKVIESYRFVKFNSS